MSDLILDISISLDGYATAGGESDDEPMGVGGHRLHAWTSGNDPEGNAILAESNGRVGGTITGRRTYERSVPFWGPDGPGDQDRTPTFIVSHTVTEIVTFDGAVFGHFDLPATLSAAVGAR